MKIILSRKGYDDEFGGKPSIILPGGIMLSFPIPVIGEEKGILSDQLYYNGNHLSTIFNDLHHKNCLMEHHLDPDLFGYNGIKPMGTFGQSGTALSHLNNQVVGLGDIFLFYGSFKHTFYDGENLTYEKMHPFHAIYGYLKVSQIIPISEDQEDIEPRWLLEHPHFVNRKIGDYRKLNAIYLGQEYGYFNFNPILQLTKSGFNKSYWQLPSFFKDVNISYNENTQKRLNGDFIEFTSAAKGQEFVFESNAQIDLWLSKILKNRVDRNALTQLEKVH